MPPLEYKTTAEVKVPERLIDWIIGQDKGANIIRKAASQRRNVLLMGQPGTGKSMLAQAMAELMPVEDLEDVLCYPNTMDENHPVIRVVKAYPKEEKQAIIKTDLPARMGSLKAGSESEKTENKKAQEVGQGRLIVEQERMRARLSARSGISPGMMLIGLALIFILILSFSGWSLGEENKYLIPATVIALSFIIAAMIFSSQISRRAGSFDSMEPKLIVDNSGKKAAPFVDATGAKAGSLFGDVKHDPLQCIPQGECILYADGNFMPIEQIVDKYFIGEESGEKKIETPEFVLGGADEEYKIQKTRVLRVFKRRYTGDLIKVKTRSGCVARVTPNHPFAVLGDDGKIEYVAAREVSLGMPVAIKEYVPDEIVSIEREPFDGFVYNLTTETGNYFVDFALTHNTGGLGTPPHLRVESGAIHRANKGVLFLDEISSLSPKAQQELLTAMQDKRYPITGQSELSSGAIVRTEAVPCDFVLVAAGNLFDIQNMHPALRSRIRGYGYEIYMEDSMPDNEENCKKLVQFVAQEVRKDGKIPHFERAALDSIIDEARRKAGRKKRLTLKLRELGGIVRAAGDVAKEEGAGVVTKGHVEKAKRLASTLEQQVSQQIIDLKKDYKVFVMKGHAVGKVNGLAVMGDGSSGLIMPIVSEVTPSSSKSEGKLIATGKLGEIAREAVENVSAVIKKHIGRDVAVYDIHVQFLQTYEGVEGDSASISVALAVISAMEGIPIDQSVAMTGSLSVRGEVLPVGGVTAKVEAAIEAGARKVLIPSANAADVYLDAEKRKRIEIVPVGTIVDVLEHALREGERKKKLVKEMKKAIPRALG
ncbi:MAG: ATP-dependent protease LonB [Candidatus Micrarchaeota archaeon]